MLVLLACAAVFGVWIAVELLVAELDVREIIALATDYIRSWGALAVLASIGLMVLHSVIPIPAEILAAANCMVFGPYWGFAITWLGAMVAALLAFGLSRYLGRPFLQRFVSQRTNRKIDEWAARNGVPALILCRLIPLVSFNVINYAAGLTNVSWLTFAWTTGIGIVPGTIVTVLVTESLLAGNTAVALLVAAAMLIVVVYWIWTRLRGAAGPQ